MGRRRIGKTKKVSITLPEDIWKKIDEEKSDISLSKFLRTEIIQKRGETKDESKEK